VADLATAASWAEVLGGLAVLIGVPVAFFEWRRNRAAKAAAAALEVMRPVQSPAFIAALERMYATPDVSMETLQGDEGLHDAARLLWATFETLGYLVYRRVVPLQVLEEFAGGSARLTWQRLMPYATQLRVDQQAVHAMEWVQWLAERLDEHPSPQKAVGAHVGHRGWRP
jgi:hypothetical protein